MKSRMTLLAAALASMVASGGVSAANIEHPAVMRALAHLRAQAAAVHTSDADSFQARDLIVDADGSEHVRFERSHRGLPVIGGDIVVHGNARGAFKSASLTLREMLRVDTQARYDEA